MKNLLFNIVYAAPTETVVKPNTSDDTIQSIISNALDTYVLPIFGGVAIGVIIYGGILYAMSQGDPEKTSRAKKTLLWGVVGVILFVASYAIVVYLNSLNANKPII